MLVAGVRLASPAKCTLTQNSNTIFLVRNALLLMLHDQLNLQQEANKAAIDSLGGPVIITRAKSMLNTIQGN